MGRLGYQSDAQISLAVSYNSLDSYAASLQDALTQPYPPYEAIGIRDGDDYRQLATSLLQIENEFYGTIRPKRVIRPGERPLHALRERGVEYVEVRLMDLDPFVSDRHHRRHDALPRRLPAALPALRQPARHAGGDSARSSRNKQRVAARGREPGLRLERGSERSRADRMGRPGARRVRADRGRARRRRRHARAPRRAFRGSGRAARSGDDAFGARAPGDRARIRQLLRALRARAVDQRTATPSGSCRSRAASASGSCGLPKVRS